eukprot:12983051-Heterocapsa_arctica.AAC.1
MQPCAREAENLVLYSEPSMPLRTSKYVATASVSHSLDKAASSPPSIVRALLALRYYYSYYYNYYNYYYYY